MHQRMNTVQLIVRGPVLYVNNRLREGVLFSNSLCLSPRPLNAWRIITPEVRRGADDSVLLKGGNRDSSLCISRSPGGVKENSKPRVYVQNRCNATSTKETSASVSPRKVALALPGTSGYCSEKNTVSGTVALLYITPCCQIVPVAHTPAPELRAGPGFTVQERAKNRTVYFPGDLVSNTGF